MFDGRDIQEIPLSSPFFRSRVERFLQANGLRMEALDAYYAFVDSDGELVAGAGIAGDVLKCLAVSAEVRSEGLLVPLVSRILSERPGPLKVFTKPEYQAVFESLGFHLIAQAPLAILLEKGNGLEQYCQYLQGFRRSGRSGVIVMNANPFTLGHLYLIQQASKQVDTLYVIPVKEDVSEFPYAERKAMILAANAIATPPHEDAVVVLEGSDYVISAATFPTYFLKDLSTVSETQMQLDLDLYQRWIAPALGASVRFVGSEPFDVLTNQYNQLIPHAVVIPRLKLASLGQAAEENYFSPAIATPPHGDAISASAVRKELAVGHFKEAASMCPVTTWPYLLAALAERALMQELDTPCKPGLVGPDGPGAHRDMDYAVMRRGITALRPFWSRMAMATSADELRQLGIDAESVMMAATGGVNTHRGAIFCLGLALNAFWCDGEIADNEQLIAERVHLQVHRIFNNLLKDSELRITGIRGARQMAEGGYQELFQDWLPFYRSTGPSAEQKTLLRIMSTLDDTCVIKRAGEPRSEEVKKEAAALLLDFSQEKLKDMCVRYAAEGISPGGAADMLSLTIFINSIL